MKSNFYQPESEALSRTGVRHSESVADLNKDDLPAKSADISAYDQLRAMVLAIDPQAQFTLPSQKSDQLYLGPIVADVNSLENSQNGFAQHIGRSFYAIHAMSAPVTHQHGNVKVRYSKGLIEIHCAENPQTKAHGIE